ncbi:MAG: hypothetical protein PVS3B2_17900 [Candidatus Dormibacteraceae bacterium]
MPADMQAVDGGQPRNFLRPCLLLLLRESPAHGYDLLERLRAFQSERDAGGLYRTLRALEHEGLVTSSWEPSYTGPDRRNYSLTSLGRKHLDSWARTLEETHRTVGSFLERHSADRIALAEG